MTQYKDGKVVMLPQNRCGWLKNDLLKVIESTTDPGKLLIATFSYSVNSCDTIPLYLYIITDDEIKEGDWVLKGTTIIEAELFSGTIGYHSGPGFLYFNPNKEQGRISSFKIIASTDPSLNLPGIQSSWLRDVYVPNQGKITDIKMEMKEVCCNIEINGGLNSPDCCHNSKHQLKLTDNNEVVILPEDNTNKHHPEIEKAFKSARKLGDERRFKLNITSIKIEDKEEFDPFKSLDAISEERDRVAKIESDRKEEQAIEDAANDYCSRYAGQINIVPIKAFKAAITWYKEYLGAKSPDS